jgi:hypothetical protein
MAVDEGFKLSMDLFADVHDPIGCDLQALAEANSNDAEPEVTVAVSVMTRVAGSVAAAVAARVPAVGAVHANVATAMP